LLALEALKTAIYSIPYFKPLQREDVHLLAENMVHYEYRKGATIVAPGEEIDFVVILEEGRAEMNGKVLSAGGVLFAEALCADVTVEHTVTTETTVRCAILPRPTLEEIFGPIAMLPKIVKGREDERLMLVLEKMPLLSSLQKAERDVLVSVVKRRDCVEGEVLIKQGERNDALYIVLSGEVVVTKADKARGDRPREVARLGPGDFLGEKSILDDTSVSDATMTVVDDTRVSDGRGTAPHRTGRCPHFILLTRAHLL
jgi:CRP-like cAMP-binding protein